MTVVLAHIIVHWRTLWTNFTTSESNISYMCIIDHANHIYIHTSQVTECIDSIPKSDQPLHLLINSLSPRSLIIIIFQVLLFPCSLSSSSSFIISFFWCEIQVIGGRTLAWEDKITRARMWQLRLSFWRLIISLFISCCRLCRRRRGTRRSTLVLGSTSLSSCQCRFHLLWPCRIIGRLRWRCCRPTWRCATTFKYY